MEGFGAKTIDANAFDDPNILIGENRGESPYANLSKVRYISRNQPPWGSTPKKGQKIFSTFISVKLAAQKSQN